MYGVTLRYTVLDAFCYDSTSIGTWKQRFHWQTESALPLADRNSASVGRQKQRFHSLTETGFPLANRNSQQVHDEL